MDINYDITELVVLFGIVGGTGLGFMYLTAIVSVGYYFGKKRAFATGVVYSASGVSKFIFPPIAEFLLKHLHGWKGAMKMFGGICLLCILCGLSFKPLTKRQVAAGSTKNHCRFGTSRQIQSLKSEFFCLHILVFQNLSASTID